MTELFTDFGLRDWLLILGPIFIVGILVHGYWRMRTNRNSLKMSLDKSFVSDVNADVESSDELSMLRAELPNGGARVRTPEQTSFSLDEDVPVLMDPVVDNPPVSKNKSESKSAPAQSEDANEVESESRAESLIEAPLGEGARDVPTDKQRKQDASEAEGSYKVPDNLPEKYMVINVMAIGAPFKGQELLECLVGQDMALGEMNIFHREQHGQTQFSLMNAVEPGSFDLAQMDQMETPAISMFMRVHELRKPTRVFEAMLNVAEALAEALGGEVRDETRSVMTTQTIEHCRQELEEYEFKNPA